MKKYKINGIIVEGNTCLDAISKIKDDVTSDIPYLLNMAKDYAGHSDWQRVANICYSIVDKLKRAKLADSIRDSVNYEYLLSEERKAVEDYKKAISETNDKNELYVLSHILKEEAHHIELLENLQKGKVEFNDSKKLKDYDKKNIINYLNKLVGNIGLHVERQIDDYKYLLKPNYKWDYKMADQVRNILESKGHEVMVIAPNVYVTLNKLAKYD